MFRHASAVVTNGGYTGVTLALSVSPTGADHPRVR
jgi:hypothetical protein